MTPSSTSREINGISYHYQPAQNPNTPVFCALHDTGGTETSMAEITAAIDGNAGFLSPRGPVNENGQNRFIRPPQGEEYDQHDIATNAKAIVQFVNEATKRHHIDRRDLIWVGYANGANMITGIMLLHPEVIQKAILFRPMSVLTPPQMPTLPEAAIFMASGRQDPIVAEDQTQRLIHLLQQTGAIVELFLHDGGHHLEDADIMAAGTWYQKQTGLTAEPATEGLSGTTTGAAAAEAKDDDKPVSEEEADETGDMAESEDTISPDDAGITDHVASEANDQPATHELPEQEIPEEEPTHDGASEPDTQEAEPLIQHDHTASNNESEAQEQDEDDSTLTDGDASDDSDDRFDQESDNEDEDDEDDDFTIPRLGRR